MLLPSLAMHGKSVLVVDDDPLICWALARELSALQMTVHVNISGMMALDEIRRTAYDLVFLDIHLPDANGLDLLKDLRKISPETRVVVMSAHADEENLRRAIEEGALQFMEKPFELPALHRLVRSMFGSCPEARMNPLYFCRIPVRIALLSPAPRADGADIEYQAGIAEELGPGGVRLVTEYPLKAGQAVRLRIGPGGSADLSLPLVPPHGTAEVLWVTRTAGGFNAELRYLNPAPAS